MRILTASVADAEIFAGLNRNVHRLHVDNVPDFFHSPTDAEVETAFRELLGKDNAHGYLAYIGDQVAGYMLVFVRERPANAFCRARRSLYLDQISVEPTWQGQGVGRALVNTARKLARVSGIDQIEVETWAFNEKAQAFFRSCGFQPRTQRLFMTNE